MTTNSRTEQASREILEQHYNYWRNKREYERSSIHQGKVDASEGLDK